MLAVSSALILRASREAASEHYDRGVELATKGQYRLASDEFKAAYEASPHFATLHNIAQAELALGRVQEAIDAFKRYLREGGDQIPDERREQVTRHLALLEARFASLTIDTDPPGAAIQVDGAELGTTPLPSPLRLAPGTVVHHLKRLDEAGLVQAKANHPYMEYSLKLDRLQAVGRRLGEIEKELGQKE